MHMRATGLVRVAVAAVIVGAATVLSGIGSQSWGEQVHPCTDYLNRVSVDATGRVATPADLQFSDPRYRCWQVP